MGQPLANCVDVEIDEGAVTAFDADVRLVRRAVDTILKCEGFSDAQDTTVVVLLTGDARIRQLNREFAGDDHVTDVLSFGAEPHDNFPADIGENFPDRIGDIAISLPQTKRQSDEKNVPFERELAMLAIHGTLHLLGYDHALPEDERIMFGKTDDALAEIFGCDA